MQGTRNVDWYSPHRHSVIQGTEPCALYTPYASPTKPTIQQLLSPSEASTDGPFGSPPHTQHPTPVQPPRVRTQEEIYITSEVSQFMSPCGDAKSWNALLLFCQLWGLW